MLIGPMLEGMMREKLGFLEKGEARGNQKKHADEIHPEVTREGATTKKLMMINRRDLDS